jgi:FAD/FMN-containing dehydrogenase
MLWPLEQAAEVMQWYREFIVQAPENISGFFAFLVVPPGPPFPEHLHLKKMCGIVWCYTGPLEEAEQIFKPVRDLRPALDLVGPLPYPALQGMFDALYSPGLQWYWKADFVKELNDEAIALHVEHGSKIPTMLSTTHLYPINGRAHQVGSSDTPWSYRDAVWAQVIVGVDPDPANKERIVAWARDYWNALHPYCAGGAYVNFMMHDEGDDRVKASYRGNYERLVAIKNKYDPANVFRVNQNLKPSAA